MTTPDGVPSGIDWPTGIEPTPARQRRDVTRFSTGLRKSKQQIQKELEDFIGADEWRIDDVTGHTSFPAIIVRWSKDGVDYAVVADQYQTKTANAREAYMWLHETRKSGDRDIKTAEDSFAAAKLDPPDEEHAIVVGEEPAEKPHEILGVEPSAGEGTIRDAYVELLKEVHPDQGGTREEFKRLQAAKNEMVSDTMVRDDG